MSESNDDSLDSVLCFLCTPSSTGCKVVGTVSVSATDSLADIRERLITASCGGESESKVGCTSYEVSCKSSGVSLNGFDFSSQFRYIRNSTVIIPISRERSILARDLFPRLPFRAAKFNHVLRQSWEKVLKTNPEVPLFTVCKSTEGHVRHLLCVLFVSHVESSTIGITASPPRIIAERAFLERLSLSPHISSFGRYFEASASWQKGLSKDNVNVRDYLGFSLLHESMIAGETIAFGHILQVSGVQVDITDNRGNTPLHLAVSLSGRETFVNALLEAGADPLAQNFSGDTPLHLSFSYKRPIAQGILCSHLRKFSHKDKDYILDLQNNFGVSIRSLFLSSVSFLELLQKGTKEAVHSFCTHFLYESERMSSLLYQWNGNSALHVAGEGGNEEVLRYLLSNGDKNPLIWELNHRHETPLHVASRLGHIKCANILVEKYPHHLSMIDIGGNTPFLLAVKSKSVGMITHMCSCYSAEQLNLHIRDARGWSALHLLCGFGFFDIAENILISHHLSFRDENVRKSFCCWYDEGNRDSIVYNKILVKQNTRLASRQRRRAITSIERISNEHYICGKESFFHEHLASESLMYSSVLAANREKSKDRCHFLLLLCKHGAVKTAEDCANMFVYFIRKRRDELLNEIIENSSRFGIESPLIEELKTQNSLLCIFCASRDNYGIRWCVESKFAGIFSGSLDDIRTPQHSPLHISISLGDAAAVEFLLSHHVSPNIEPLEKRVSPLSWALQHPSTSQSAIIEALVRSGSRVVRERADSSIWNAIEEASILNNEYAVRALVGCDSSGVTLALESALQKAAFNELLRIRRNTKGENEHKNLGRICAFLSEHACWSSSNVHPYELISLAAHAHFFEVVENLIKKLLQGRTYLSDASLPFLKVSAPPPPPMPQREIIAPKPTIPVGCKNCGTRKALYAPKKTTYTRYYRRLLLPSCIHRVDIQRVEIKIEGFPHRLVRRDAFSFLAEYGRVDLMESLFDLHFTPWEGGDRRGWSPADYAIRGLKREAFRFLVEHGVFPLCQHGEADILLKSTIYGSLIRSAISFFSEGTVTPPVVIQTMLKNRVDDSVIMNYSRTSLGTFMVKNQVDSGSPAQFPVSILEECVRLSRLSLLSFFVEEYRLQVQHFETLLLWGAITENEETIEWLIQHGCSLTASATLPETVNLPLALKKVFRKWKSVSPLFLAVAACSLSTISVMVLCTPCLLSLPPSVVVGRVICGDGNISRGSASSNVESPATPDGKDVLVALAERIRNLSSLHLEAETIEIVKVLSRCGLPYCSSQVIQAACKKHFYSLIVNLLKCYGKEVVLADLDYLRNLSPPTSFYGTLFHAVAVNEGVCVAFEELLAVQNNTDLIENLTNFAKAQFRYQLSCLGSTMSDSRNIVGGTIVRVRVRVRV